MTANRKSPARKRSKRNTNSPSRILAIDIGGSKVKLLASGETEPRRLSSGKRLTPVRLAQSVKELTDDWKYDAVSIGYPGQVGADGPRAEPGNLGPGWVGFDFAAAFERRKEAEMLAELYELAAEEVAATHGFNVEQLTELALSDPQAAEALLTQAGMSEAAYSQPNTNDVQTNADAAGVDVQTFTGQEGGQE